MSAHDLNTWQDLPSQYSMKVQAPHDLPQPSGPQAFPWQRGVHRGPQTPSSPQNAFSSQVPHNPPHPSGPQSRPIHDCAHVPSQCPFRQYFPSAHVPHCPSHPSSPHSLPAQDGEHVPVDSQRPFLQIVPTLQAVPGSHPEPSLRQVAMLLPWQATARGTHASGLHVCEVSSQRRLPGQSPSFRHDTHSLVVALQTRPSGQVNDCPQVIGRSTQMRPSQRMAGSQSGSRVHSTHFRSKGSHTRPSGQCAALWQSCIGRQDPALQRMPSPHWRFVRQLMHVQVVSSQTRPVAQSEERWQGNVVTSSGTSGLVASVPTMSSRTGSVMPGGLDEGQPARTASAPHMNACSRNPRVVPVARMDVSFDKNQEGLILQVCSCEVPGCLTIFCTSRTLAINRWRL